MMIPAYETMRKLLEFSGAKVIADRYILKAGVKIIKQTKLEPDTSRLFTELGIYCLPESIMSAEFNARLTYLNFRHASSNSSYVKRITEDLGHYSIYGDWSVSLLIAGVTDEILKELAAHNEAHISRLTSSNTRVQAETFYVLDNDQLIDQQIHFIEEFLQLRSRFEKQIDDFELWNSLNLPVKAGYCVFTMTLKDFHKFFIGRLPVAGNETMLRKVVKEMCLVLNANYPEVIKDPSFYEMSSNLSKLDIN